MSLKEDCTVLYQEISKRRLISNNFKNTPLSIPAAGGDGSGSDDLKTNWEPLT